MERKKAKCKGVMVCISTMLMGLLLAVSSIALAAEDFDPKTEKTLIEIFRENRWTWGRTKLRY
jgi:hypothetical protein